MNSWYFLMAFTVVGRQLGHALVAQINGEHFDAAAIVVVVFVIVIVFCRRRRRRHNRH